MTISSIPATTVQSLATATSTTQSNPGTAGTMGTMGSQLLAAIAQMEAAGNASSPLLQEIASLSGNSPGSQTAPLTYNAQGLMGQTQLLSDPLLQSSGSGASTSTSGSSASLAQALQSDPAMAATVVQTQIDQGILSMLS